MVGRDPPPMIPSSRMIRVGDRGPLRKSSLFIHAQVLFPHLAEVVAMQALAEYDLVLLVLHLNLGLVIAELLEQLQLLLL